MASIAQIRAARRLVDWSQSDLATASGLSRGMVSLAERSDLATINAITRMQAATSRA